MSIVNVTGGVDTHSDTHVVAAVDGNGGCWESKRFLLDVPAMRACWVGWQRSVVLIVWELRGLVPMGEGWPGSCSTLRWR